MDTHSGLNSQLELLFTKQGTKASIILDTRVYNGKRKAVLMPLMILATMWYCCSLCIQVEMSIKLWVFLENGFLIQNFIKNQHYQQNNWILYDSLPIEESNHIFDIVFYAIRYINPKAKIIKCMKSKLTHTEKKRIKNR